MWAGTADRWNRNQVQDSISEIDTDSRMGAVECCLFFCPHFTAALRGRAPQVKERTFAIVRSKEARPKRELEWALEY